MTPDVAKKLFTEWGEWSQRVPHNLGHATTNSIGRLIVQGGGASQATSPVIPDMSAGVQHAEDAINDMEDRTKDVLIARYIYKWSREQTAREYKGYKEAEVRQRLEGAVYFFCGRMSNKAVDSGAGIW